MRIVLVACAFLLSGCLTAGISVTSSEGPAPVTTSTAQQGTPYSAHDVMDLRQGLQQSYSFEIHGTPTKATAHAFVVGPVDQAGYSPHGTGGNCVEYSRVERTGNSYSSSNGKQGNCGSGLSFGSDNLMAVTLIDWDMAGIDDGEYTLKFSSDPQVGELHVDIVVEY